MTIRRYLRDALVAAILFAGLQVYQACLLRDALRQQDHLLVWRLQSTVAGVLNEAHKAKDDLTMFHILNALLQSRGMTQARVVDEKTEKTMKFQSGDYLYALKDGDRKWGSLVLAFSDRFNRKMIRRQWLKGMGVMSVVWGLFFLYLQVLEKRTAEAQAKMVELTSLLETEKRKLSDVQEREQMALFRISAGLQKAIALVSVPVLVLDAQQRLAALSPLALSWLGVIETRALIGKSWNHIPLLAACGKELERSLVYPGQAVQCSSRIGDIHLTFETDADGLAGTWVTLSKPLHVVE